MTDQIPEEALPLGHEYWGNICSGFGAPLACERRVDGRKCGKSPYEHEPGSHRLRLPTPAEFDQAQRDVITESHPIHEAHAIFDPACAACRGAI